MAAIDFRQVLDPDFPNDRWLGGQLSHGYSYNGATFRFISEVHTPDPNGPAGYVLPDRDLNGATPLERLTTFVNLPVANQNAAARFGVASLPMVGGSPVLTETRIERLLSFQTGSAPGTAGYWMRLAIELPSDVDPALLYVAEAIGAVDHRVLAQGRLQWGTQSLQDSDDPSRDTYWVIAEVPEPATVATALLAMMFRRRR